MMMNVATVYAGLGTLHYLENIDESPPRHIYAELSDRSSQQDALGNELLLATNKNP